MNEVAVAWFTAPDQPRVRLAFSADGGRTFGPPLEVASGKVVGRVDVVLLQDGRAVVSWLAETANGAVIRAQPFNHAGAADCRHGHRDIQRRPLVGLSADGPGGGRPAVRVDRKWIHPGSPHGLRAAALTCTPGPGEGGRCASISAPFFNKTRPIGAR